MKCPACPDSLSRYRCEPVTLDVCHEGCGGIWFDRSELEQLEALSSPPSLRILANKNRVVDFSRPRTCPKCPGHHLTRLHHDTIQQLELDECSQCGGMWVDLGELQVLQTERALTESIDSVYEHFIRQYQGKNVAPPPGVRAVLALIFGSGS